MTKIYGLYYEADTGASEDGNVMYMGPRNTEFFSKESLRDNRFKQLEKMFKACEDAEDVIVPEIWTTFEFELDSVNTNTIPDALSKELAEMNYKLNREGEQYVLEDLGEPSYIGNVNPVPAGQGYYAPGSSVPSLDPARAEARAVTLLNLVQIIAEHDK